MCNKKCFVRGFIHSLFVSKALTRSYLARSGFDTNNSWIKPRTPHFLWRKLYLLYRHECFTGKYTTRKIHKNYIRDPSGLFSIISHVSLSMIWLISSLSLKLYLNSLVYHRNIFGSSSKVFGNHRKSSDIFGNFREMFGNVRLAFGTILENLRKSSEGGRKSSENHQKRRHQHVYIIKRTLHGGLKIWILFSRGKNNILLTRCARS